MKKQIHAAVGVSFLLFLFSAPFAIAEQVYISVGQARVKKSVIAFPDTKYLAAGVDSGDRTKFAKNVRETINNDLNFTNLFTIQSPSAFIEKDEAGILAEQFKMSDWSTIGSEFLIKTGISITGSNVSYEMRLYDVLGAKQILGKRYIAKVQEPTELAHTVADDVMEALTGKKGIFKTKIAMVCNKGSRKEIWQMSFDGSNPKQLTRHRSLSFSPAWSRDSQKLAYSLYTRNRKNIKNIDLYEYDFRTQKSSLLSNRQGINSGADYSPDGKHIAMTMSFLNPGSASIFLLDRSNRQVRPIARSLGMDVDPAFSPDGKKIAFVSTRHEVPMVYTMSADGNQVTRITYAGKYNATPDWAPDGKRLVFAGFMDDHFDIYLINPDGTKLERLTKNEGNNEDPSFSPDGNFITFSSNRGGQKNIYLISVDGTYTKRLTFGLGECEAPKWSGYLDRDPTTGK